MRFRLLFVLFLLLCTGTADARTLPATGQWIWSQSDREVFHRSQKMIPNLVPTIWISSFSVASGSVTQKPALSPVMKGSRRVGVVIRFNPSFTDIWKDHTDDEVFQQVDPLFRDLQKHWRAAGSLVDEVQLDYDCPQRLLERWAHLARTVAIRNFSGTPVWVTSLVTHLRQPDYGSLFGPPLAGHILQVFDTGDEFSPAAAREVAALAERTGLRFRLGLGAFERGGRSTSHRQWFSAIHLFSTLSHFSGLWVFPAANDWAPLLEVSPR